MWGHSVLIWHRFTAIIKYKQYQPTTAQLNQLARDFSSTFSSSSIFSYSHSHSSFTLFSSYPHLSPPSLHHASSFLSSSTSFFFSSFPSTLFLSLPYFSFLFSSSSQSLFSSSYPFSVSPFLFLLSITPSSPPPPSILAKFQSRPVFNISSLNNLHSNARQQAGTTINSNNTK